MANEEIGELADKVKLIKNTKGYSWEISLVGDWKGDTDVMVSKLEDLESRIRARFGEAFVPVAVPFAFK